MIFIKDMNDWKKVFYIESIILRKMEKRVIKEFLLGTLQTFCLNNTHFGIEIKECPMGGIENEWKRTKKVF